MPVVVVESPAKAKTIEKYLGKNYKVLASFGHIRDIRRKKEAVDPDHDFAIDWEITPDSKKRIKPIVDALKKDPALILATDPDREGEAISWHLEEILRNNHKSLKIKSSERISFTSITKNSIKDAIQSPRKVDSHLVDAYLARRVLDFLVGFNLSPILWTKFPCGASAGRVQSVCLRLITERELDREAFEPRSYWTILADCLSPKKMPFQSVLTHLNDEKLSQFSFASSEDAEAAKELVASKDRYWVKEVVSKDARINPPPPFTTATLQQEANRKLRLGSDVTMKVAQKLYEAGHITYMRTDAINMAPEAIQECRKAIAKEIGNDFVVQPQRVYKNKAKNSQEAHECIRPTAMHLVPARAKNLSAVEGKLYDMIWKRTLATQMKACVVKNTKVILVSDDTQVSLQATGQVPVFAGFKKIYEEGVDESQRDKDHQHDHVNTDLPPLAKNDVIELQAVDVRHSETKPPFRFTEATLVKEMVNLGIGRPSTYASIIATLKTREYIQTVPQSRNLQPTATGRLVTAFLKLYFPKYVEYDFTAEMEKDLDEISGGREDRINTLSDFWNDFSLNVAAVSDIDRRTINEKVSELVYPQFVTTTESDTDLFKCPNPKCDSGRLELKVFKGRAPYFSCRDCKYNQPLERGKEGTVSETVHLGTKEDTNQKIFLKSGPYGKYLELEKPEETKTKPKRVSIPEGMSTEEINLDVAIQLLDLPRTVGNHPDDGQEITAHIGRNGPYLKHGQNSASIPDSNPLDALSIGINRAVSLLAGEGLANDDIVGEHPEGGSILRRNGRYGPYVKWKGINATIPRKQDPLTLSVDDAVSLLERKKGAATGQNGARDLGPHPTEKGPVKVLSGRYGPYVKWKRVNASIPKHLEADSITLDQAVELIEKKVQSRR